MSMLKDNNKPITVKYIWDKDTFTKGSKSLYMDMLRNSPKRFIGWFFIGLSQFGLVAFYKKGAFGLLMLSTVFLLYWYVLRWPIRKIFLLKSFKNSPLKDKNIEITFDNNYILIDNIKLKYKDIPRVLIEKAGYLFYYQDNFFFIPKESIKEEEKFIKMIKKRISSTIDRRQ